MLRNEKKSLLRFIAIYSLLVIALVITVATIYYNVNQEKIKLEHKSLMQDFATLQSRRLKWLHNHFPKYNTYPRDTRFKSAIYDENYNEILSLVECKDINFNKNLYYCNKNIVYIQMLSDYYLGAKYLLIEIPRNSSMANKLLRDVALFSIISLFFLLGLGYYLARLFIKPMRESIDVLDKFIKDTTHEINTPISIINTNIEMIDKGKLDKKSLKLINRVKIASRTLENIYKDLKYLTLNEAKNRNIEKINLKELIQERVEYFQLHMNAKKIKCKLELEDFIIEMDRSHIIRIVDNILSNAIKYNKINGEIVIKLKNKMLTIQDSGIGIDKENLKDIFIRYKRFNNTEGGFGIGLNIVQNIIEMYNLKIKIESKKDVGVKVIIIW